MQLSKIILFIQIGASILLIASILLQQRGAGSSAITGGNSASYYTKRGFEKILFMATIIFASIFIITALGSVFLTKWLKF